MSALDNTGTDVTRDILLTKSVDEEDLAEMMGFEPEVGDGDWLKIGR